MPALDSLPVHLSFLLWCDIPDDDRDCWDWTGPWGTNNRPIFPHRESYPFKDFNASRSAFRLFRGEPTLGNHIEHLCNNSYCVNPWHLADSPPKTNYDRLKRTHCKHGHELTEDNRLTAGEYAPGKPRFKCRTCARQRERLRVR